MKRYGMILADNGSPWHMSGAPNRRSNDDALHLLHRLTGRDSRDARHALASASGTLIGPPVVRITGARPWCRRPLVDMSESSPAGGRNGEPARGSRARLTERDLRLLEFIADHRLVLACHVQTLLETSAAVTYGRLRSLTTGGYLRQRKVFHRQPGCYQITRKGLAAIDSGYLPPQIDLARYRHDVGVAWLWLAARSGAFGLARDVISERRLRSHDASPERSGEPLGVRLGGYGPGGKPRLHYPDLLIVLAAGQRVAVELELTAKGRTRRETILSGYAVDSRIDAVLYLAQHPAIARSVRSSARMLGVANRVHVQPFRWSPAAMRAPAPIRATGLAPPVPATRLVPPVRATRVAPPVRASARTHVHRDITR